MRVRPRQRTCTERTHTKRGTEMNLRHMSRRDWVILTAVSIVIGFLVHLGGGLTTSNGCDTGYERACDFAYVQCQANWDAHRNDTLLAYTKSAYVKECVSSAHAIDQYVKDHQ